MNSVPKIDFVITARPSWARVKNLISEFVKLEGSNSVRISLLAAAISDKYGDIRNQIPSDIELNVFETFSGNDNLFMIAKTSIEGARSLSQSWSSNPPLSVLVIADRTETLGVSLAAATMQIPLIHLQGGEISGSIDNKIRAANSKLADYHLTTNKSTAKNLINLGEKTEDIVIIGCPSIDIVFERLQISTDPLTESLLYGGVGANFFTDNPYGIIMFHPDTLQTSNNNYWIDFLIEMTQSSNLNWFWFWPNIDFGGESISKKIRLKRELNEFKNVRFLKNLPPSDFIDLAISAKIIVGNSSFGIREASAIGLPSLNLGNRQNKRERADNVFDISVPSDLRKVVADLSSKRFKQSTIYGAGNASQLGAIALNNWTPKLKGNYTW
jgi:UDP-hydrolysing UDP-N-acetyl-D-glucosamine 2-epimerase